MGFILLPAALRVSLFPNIPLAVATLTFVAVVVSGLTVVGDQRRRETEQQNQVYAAVFDALPDPLHAKDLDSRFIAANPATAALMRVKDVKDLIGHDDFDFYPHDVAARFRHDEQRLIAEGKPFSLRQPVTFLDGSTGMLATLKAPLRDKAGKIVGLITHNRDITESTQLEEKYEQSQRRLGQALANMADGLAMFDRQARIIVCNPQYAALFPKTKELRVAGADLHDILRAGVASGEEMVPPGVETEAWIEAKCGALRVSADSDIELGDGRWLEARVRPSEDGTSLTVISEITAAKKAEVALVEVNARLDALAKTDGLTGLMNRRAFDETLAGECARSARTSAPISLLMIDVDRFKAFNDTYGHPAGDEALRAISQCLTTTLKRPADIAARYGGEELVALLPDTTNEGAARLGEEFRVAVRDLRIRHTGSEKGCVTVSIGIATSDRAATKKATDLVRHADEALYNAKASGRDRVHEWTPPRAAEPRKAG